MKKKLIPGFLLAFILVFSMAVFAACSGGYSGLHIDAPERVEADLGIYYIPTYHVVDESGAVYSGSANEDLKVKVKSIKDQNNNKVELTGNTITVREAGDYKFVYGVDGRGIEDVAVTVAFADRTAPTVTLDEDLPAMYIVGNSYSMPLYSLAGDYVLDRCYAELYLSDDEEGTNLTKVQLDGNVFEVTKEQMGKYNLLRFHAEDAAGNYNEYNYYRPVDGPGEVLENTVVYFNDAFGARQAEPQESYYQGEAVGAEEAALPENAAMPGETGYYKLSFSGDKVTSNHEGYLCVESPAITDIRSYTKLEFWVYFDPGDTSSLPAIDGVDYDTKSVIVGMPWWGDTTVAPKTWTKVSFSVQNWGGGNGNPTDRYNDAVLRSDISGMRLRFLWDYSAAAMGLLPYGTFYLSRVTAVPGEVSTIRCEDSRVWTNESTYYIGQTVTLSAEDAGPGETFDCFVVDGEPIAGNTFIATKETHSVTVRYVEGELTAGNMSWGTSFTDVRPLLVDVQAGFLNENLITAYTAGSDRYWALSFDVAGGFDPNAATNQKFGVSIYFGNTRTFEFQINGTAGSYTGNFKHYGNGNYNQIGTLSEELVQAFIGASEEAPVHIDAVRLGDYMHVYVNGEYFYLVTIPGLTMYGDHFGYAWRVESADVTNTPIILNAKSVTGQTKATAAFESFSGVVEIVFEDGVTAEKDTYYMGESVRLTAPEAPEGQTFLHFTVNGEPIEGDTFLLTERAVVGAVFAQTIDVAFTGGAGYTGSLIAGSAITLTHEDREGQIFDYYLVNGTEKVFGDRYTLTDETKSIEAVYTDCVENMTWQDGTQGKTPAEWGLPQSEIDSHAGNGQNLYILGAADRWAIRETVYGGRSEVNGAQYYFSFMVSSCVQVEFQILSNGNVTIGMAGSGEWTNFVTQTFDARAVYSVIANATKNSPVTFLCIRDGNDLYLFAEGELLLKAQPKFNYSNPFGYGTRNVNTAAGFAFPTTVSRGFITDSDKIDALLAAQVSKINADENVVLEKTEYRMGETVTLTAKEAPEGKSFVYFTVDGVRIEGNTFTATAPEHTVAAVYEEIIDVAFTGGAGYEGVLVPGSVIELKHEPGTDGKIFDYYLVNGSEKVFEDSYMLKRETRSIAAVYAASAEEMTWKTAAYTQPTQTIGSWGAYRKLGSAADWIVAYDITATNGVTLSNGIRDAWYAGVLFRNDQIVGYEMGDNVSYKLYLGSAGDGAGSTWDKMSDGNLSWEVIDILNAASAGEPVTLYFVRQGNMLTAFIGFDGTYYLTARKVTHAAFDESYGLDFGYGWRTDCGGIPAIENIRFVTGEEKTQCFLDSLTVKLNTVGVTAREDSYSLGDVVYVTADRAPSGYEFDYYKVDGKRIVGNSFYATKTQHTVTAVYRAMSSLTLGEGVKTVGGTWVSRGSTVTLRLTGEVPEGKVLNGYQVDGTLIPGNTFVTTAAAHTIEAVFVDSVDEMTWPSEGLADAQDVITNGACLGWLSNNKFEGQAVGESTKWAISLDVSFKDFQQGNWYSVEFLQGGASMLRFMIYRSGNDDRVEFRSAGSGVWATFFTLQGDEAKAIIDECIGQADSTARQMRTAGTVNLTCVRNEEEVSLFFNGKLLCRTTYGFNRIGNWFGYGEMTENDSALHPEIVSAGYTTVSEKIDAILEGSTEALTAAITTDGNTTTDKESYIFGETVTLTAADAPEGMVFSHFTVDGERIEGNTFVASKSTHKVAAVYVTPVAVKFAEGVTYEGELYEGATIKLDYTGAIPEGQALSHFTLNGTPVNGNELKLTADMAGQTIAAVFTAPAAARWTEVAYTEPTDTIDSWGVCYKLGSDANWIVSYEMTATNGTTLSNGIQNAWYAGVLFRNDQIVGYEMGDNASYKQYLGSAGDGAGSTWDKMSDGNLSQEVIDILNGASAQSPVTLIFARQGNTLSAYIECNGSVYCVVKDKTHTAFDEQYGLDFGYGWRTDSGGIPTIQNIRYLTGAEKVEAWLNETMISEISTDENTATDKNSYVLGETVTLTAAAAPEGKAFSHFTVDGAQIEGNTFVASKSAHAVAAVYVPLEELYEIKVEYSDFVTVDGNTLTLPSAEIVDKDGAPVSGYTIETIVSDAMGNEYSVSNGQITLTYAGSVTITVIYSMDGANALTKTIEFVVQRADGIMFVPTQGSDKLIDGNGNTVSYDTSVKYGTEEGSLKVVVANSSETAIKLPKFDMTGYRFIELYAYTTASGVKLGGWWCMDQTLTANAWTRILLDNEAVGWTNGGLQDIITLRIFGSCNNQTIYLSSVKAFDKEQEGTRLTDISYYKSVSSIGSAEYVTDKKYEGDDTAITEEGSLKVTISGTDSGIASIFNYVIDLSAYGSVYFYVYTDASDAKSGAYWCGDTSLTAGSWTKVELTAAMASGGPWNACDNSKIFDVGLKDMVVRFMGAAGDTFWVTSLYGVPKA